MISQLYLLRGLESPGTPSFDVTVIVFLSYEEFGVVGEFLDARS
jgi:hypothetical protein